MNSTDIATNDKITISMIDDNENNIENDPNQKHSSPKSLDTFIEIEQEDNCIIFERGTDLTKDISFRNMCVKKKDTNESK